MHSVQWNKELKDWTYLKKQAGEQMKGGGLKIRAYSLFAFFFFVTVLVMYVAVVAVPSYVAASR